MYDEMEAKLKEACAGQLYTTTNATNGHDLDRPKADQWTKRIRRRCQEAEEATEKAAQYRELLALLDRNPEVARILDLVNQLGL